MEKRVGIRQITYIASLFLIAQFVGLLLISLAYFPSYISAQASSGQSNPVSFVFWLIINIIILITIMMLIFRYYKGDMFFKLLEAYIVMFGSFFFFLFAVSDAVPSVSFVIASAASFCAAVLLFVYKSKTNRNRNLVTMIASIGAGVFIGVSIGISFGFLMLYAMLGIFAVYDYLAVFVLKFMIPFAKEASNRNLSVMIGSSDMEILPKGQGVSKMKKEDIAKISSQEVKSAIAEGSVPMVSSIMLGNGDIILPMVLATGAYAIYANFFLSAMIIAGAGTGLLVTMALLRRYKVGLPAIPPLFAFISIFLAVAFFVSGSGGYAVPAAFLVFGLISVWVLVFTLRSAEKRQTALSVRPG